MKPSITQLLQLLDKPALLNWANQQGLKGIDINVDRNRFLNAGNSIHNQIQDYVKNGTPFINREAQDNYIKFISDKEILGIENNIETEWFVGRYDIKLKWNGKIYIMDFKNNGKKIYFEHKLQLIGYGMGTDCDSFAIVSVPEFKVMNFKVDNREPYIEILKCLSKIYTLKSELNTL